MLGPSSRRTSASTRMGTGPAFGVSMGSAARRSKSACEAGSNFTTRSNAVARSKMRPTGAPAKLVSTASATSFGRSPYRAIAGRFSTNRTTGTSVCCSSDTSTAPGMPRHDIPDPLAEAAERQEIVAEDLDGDVGPAFPTACGRSDARSADQSSRSCPAASRTLGEAPRATPHAGGRCHAGPHRSPRLRRLAHVRRIRRVRSGVRLPRLPAAPSRICSTRRPISSDFGSDVPGSVFA